MIRYYYRENLCFPIRFSFLCVVIAWKFSSIFLKFCFVLKKSLSNFSFFMLKFTVISFFLLFRDKQQSIISILSKFLLNRWWQILYCRRPFLLDGIKLVFNDIYKITSLLHMLQYSSLFQKKALHSVLCLLLLGGSKISSVLLDYLSFGPAWSKWLIIGNVDQNGKDYPPKVHDNLIPAKLQFFSFTASLFEPFLLKYQSNKPMLHFYMKIFWN